MGLRTLYDEASLWMTPGGYEDGKLFSELPTDGSGDFTFSRGSNLAATRVGPTGLIEKGRENLLTYSNDFSNAAWNYTTNGVTRTASSIIDPDGGTNAWEITTTATNEHHRVGHTITSGQVKTFSFYAKANGYEYVRFWSFSGGNTGSNYFHLSGAGTAVANGQLGIASIESVGDGWYRCQGVLDPVNSTAVVISPAPDASTAAGTSTYLADGTSGIYLYHAQLEAGLVATDYIETGASTAQAGILEDMPRLDYSGGATCPSLLLEPQRVQLVPYTEYLDTSTTWTGYPSADPVTHTQNYAIAPDGTQTASLLANFTSGGFNIVNNSNYRTSTLATQNPLDDTYTMSVWLKTTSGTGTISLLNRGLSSGTNTPQSLQCSVTNEWQRFDLSNTYTAAEGASSLGFVIIKTNTDTLEEVLVWGAQMEQGSYPTSYIPNHSGGSATRTGEASSVMDVPNFTGNPSVSLFVDLGEWKGSDINNSNIYLSSASFSTQIQIRLRPDGMRVYLLNINGTDQYLNLGVTTASKILIKYDGNKYVLFINGVEIQTAASVGDSKYEKLYFNGYSTTLISELLLFPEALSDAECIALTTL